MKNGVYRAIGETTSTLAPRNGDSERRLRVLMYHKVNDRPENPLSVPVAKFDEQMNRHGLRHARYWGLAKVTAQVLLNALTVNAKRAVKLLALRPQPPDPIPILA